MKAYAAYYDNDEVLRSSSSGGVFSALAERTIAMGGVVFGARFDAEWRVVLDYTDSLTGLAALRGSKYVQARIGDAFEKAEQFLAEGRLVLFVAMPCQIAGLRKRLSKDYPNLTCVECICHGVPPSRLWEQYLQEVCDRKHTIHDIHSISFRDKAPEGWHLFHQTITWRDGYRQSQMHDDAVWMRGLMRNLTLNHACYHCAHKLQHTCADLTIGDLWGAEQLIHQANTDRGLSLVISHTEKGDAALQNTSLRVLQDVDLNQAVQYNHALQYSVAPHPAREQMDEALRSGKPIIPTICALTRDPWMLRFKLMLAKIIRILRHL